MTRTDDDPAAADVRTPTRLYLHEPGWRIGHKVDSHREFCYMMAPGQDYYHRLVSGELYLYNHEERLCVACAERRGLLSRAPKGLRDTVSSGDRIDPEGSSEFEVRGMESES